MKKTILFLSLVAASLGSSLQAQDTVWMKPAPQVNYFNNNWIDTSQRYVAGILSVANSHVIARQFHTQDTLQIYGIAAMMTDLFFGRYEPTPSYPDLQSYLNAAYPEDPSYERCEELLVLYQYNETDSVLMRQLGEGLPIHLLYTPVSYYVMSNTPVVSYMDTIPKPVYERYFNIPQIVYDTFYAGFTKGDYQLSKIDSIWHRSRPPFCCVNVGYPDQRNLDEVVANLFQDSVHLPREWHFERDYNHGRYVIFPILTPPDTTVNPVDTIINPNDTITPGPGGDTTGVGIRTPDLLYRYTSVQPNPATDKVRVTSSFGLTRIEAYDLRGRLLFETPASGLKADLDVSSWPRGTYLLRITTPAGPTTKKLLIQ